MWKGQRIGIAGRRCRLIRLEKRKTRKIFNEIQVTYLDSHVNSLMPLIAGLQMYVKIDCKSFWSMILFHFGKSAHSFEVIS